MSPCSLISHLLWSFLLDEAFILISWLPGYVGAATVGAAAWWFTVSEDGPQVTLYQLVRLTSWGRSFFRFSASPHSSASPTEPLPPVWPRQPRVWWPGLPRVWVSLPHDHGLVSLSHYWDVQCPEQVSARSGEGLVQGSTWLQMVTVNHSVQSVREPVAAAYAPLGECLAIGGHLPVNVPPLPHPLCGTSACECTQQLILQWFDNIIKQNWELIFHLQWRKWWQKTWVTIWSKCLWIQLLFTVAYRLFNVLTYDLILFRCHLKVDIVYIIYNPLAGKLC